jgi:hypothetical protein
MHIYTKKISEIGWIDVEAFCNTKIQHGQFPPVPLPRRSHVCPRT